MKKSTAILLIVVSATCGAVFARQQVLVNGSFEAVSLDPNGLLVPDAWIPFGGQVTTVRAFDGQRSAFLSLISGGNGSTAGYYRDTVSVGEGVRVLLKAQAYDPSAHPLSVPSSHAGAGMKLEFFPAGGLPLPPAVENLAFDVNAPVDQWVLVSLTTPVPNDPNYATVNAAKVTLISWEFPPDPNVALTNGLVYADSAWAEVASNPGVNLLSNASFETGTSAKNGFPPWVEFADTAFGSGVRKACLVSGVPAQQGNCVIKFIGATTGTQQNVPVTPGDTLTMWCYFYSHNGGAYPNNPYNDPYAKAGVKIEWSAGDYPQDVIDVVPNGDPASATTNIVHHGDPNSPMDAWQPITIGYTMPAGMSALLRSTIINYDGNTLTSEFYVDAFETVLANVFDGADVNGDNAEDMIDVATLQTVYTGPGAPLKYLGMVYDMNDSGALEFSDASYVLQHMTGPVNP
jgi:hypothetical protein